MERALLGKNATIWYLKYRGARALNALLNAKDIIICYKYQFILMLVINLVIFKALTQFFLFLKISSLLKQLHQLFEEKT